MRYQVVIGLNDSRIPKDKNRMILSFFKHHLQNSDEEFFNKLYNTKEAFRKNFTFSLYMQDSKFERDCIIVPNQKIYLSFSTYDLLTGIQFYNAMIKGRKKEYTYMNTVLKIERVELKKEQVIRENKAALKTLSPIVIREHNEENNKDWFHNIETERGKQLFIENMKYQILDSLDDAKYDIDEIEVEVLKNKEVKVKHYNIEILSNICTFEIKAKSYIIDYIYKSGIGSFKSAGFGMLTKV